MATGILKYKMVERINPQNKEEDPKWYAKAVQDRTVDFEALCTHKGAKRQKGKGGDGFGSNILCHKGSPPKKCGQQATNKAARSLYHVILSFKKNSNGL